jgi:hypothetical protein
MDAIDQVARARFNRVPLVKGERRHFEAEKQWIDVDVREVDGRPVVLYVATPAGTPSASIVDFSKVRVVPR